MLIPLVIESRPPKDETDPLKRVGTFYEEPSAYVVATMEKLQEATPELLSQFRPITRKEILEISIGKTLSGTDTPITFDSCLTVMEICTFYEEISKLLERVEEKGPHSFLEGPTCIYVDTTLQLLEEVYFKKSPHVKNPEPDAFIPPFEILFMSLLKGKEGYLSKGAATLDFMNNSSFYCFLEMCKVLASRDIVESFLENIGIADLEFARKLSKERKISTEEICKLAIGASQRLDLFESNEATLPYRDFLTLFTSIDEKDSTIEEHYFCIDGLAQLLAHEFKSGSMAFSLFRGHYTALIRVTTNARKEIAHMSERARKFLDLSEKKELAGEGQGTLVPEEEEDLKYLDKELSLEAYFESTVDKVREKMNSFLNDAKVLNLLEND